VLRSAIFPLRYVQGAGAIDELGKFLEPLGDRALAVLDPGIADLMEPLMRRACGDRVSLVVHRFGGESTEAAMREAADLAATHGCRIIIGVGGGKAIDTAKGAVHFHPARLVVIPTICASDAPCSKNAVVYRADGAVDRDIHGLFNPDIVLVDSAIIAKAPVRYLSAGIADALSTWFEADSSYMTRHVNFTGYRGAKTAYSIARLCYDTLLENAPLAVRHADMGIVTPQLEDTIEACTLMSTVGFESGGLGAAHGIHQGLTELPETHGFLHGEKVAIGILASLFLTQRPAALIEKIYRFHLATRLPVCLGDLAIIDKSPVHLMVAVERIMGLGEVTHWEPVKYDKTDCFNALIAADAYGEAIKAEGPVPTRSHIDVLGLGITYDARNF
jgi:glycerol dehydrogenase